MVKQNKLFLLSWDQTGLETVLDLSTWEQLYNEEEKQRLVDILSDPDGNDPGNKTMRSINQAVNGIMLRARVNSQRHYEIYTIQADPSVSEGDMWDLFNSDPQHAAELIRERGNKLFSDCVQPSRVVIT